MRTRPRPTQTNRLGLLLTLSLAAPSLAAAQAEPGDALVAEALFLADTLPAGSHDLNLLLAVDHDEAGRAVTAPTLQYAAPLGDRAGFTLDLAIPPAGEAVDAPALSLKLLLVPPDEGATGLSACLDLQPSFRAGVPTAAGVGLGAIRQVGPVALRMTGLVASPVSTWDPALQAGVSAALQLGSRLRVLAEVVADAAHGRWHWSAGPTLKVALAEKVSLMGGVLVALDRGGPPTFTVQLTSTI